jgi:very-short-patch-repair endonuclease
MLRDQAPKPTGKAIYRARKLRKEMSLPEVLLWRVLRGQPQGVKFRRQHPAGEFNMDFYCSDARLCIEIDGIAHGMGDRPLRDSKRDEWMRSQGIDTIRVAASDVLGDASVVGDALIALARSRLPLHHPALLDGPPPRDKLGEDLELAMRKNPSHA